MGTKVLFVCDNQNCKEEVNSEFYKIKIEKHDNFNFKDWSMKDKLNAMGNVEEYELCPACTKKLNDFIKNLIKQEG